MTRDSKLWWVLIAGSVVTALASNMNLIDPLIPVAYREQVQAALNLLALIVATISAKMATSPLPHSDDGSSVDPTKLPLILLVCGLAAGAAGCASVGTVLYEADHGIHATLATADDLVTRACSAGLRSAPDCRAFNAVLADSYAAYRRFNGPAQEGSIAGVPAMVTALADLRDQVIKLAPQAQELSADLQRWYTALKRLLPKETK